jgi:Fibronectin type III domain
MKRSFITLGLLPILALASLVPARSTTLIEDLQPVTGVTARPSVNATYGNGSILVSWKPSSDALQYAVKATRVGTTTTTLSTVSKESTKAVVEGLVGGATYIVQVRVIGDGHASPWTSNTLTADPLTMPKAPLQPNVTPQVNSALVTWSDLSGLEDGGSPVTQYRITEIYSKTTLTAAPTDTSVTFAGLVAGSTAAFTVSAITDVAPNGIDSVVSNNVTILAPKTVAPSSAPPMGRGFGGEGISSLPSGSPTPTPTPSLTASPSPSLTAIPSPSSSPTQVMTSPSPIPTPQRSYIRILSGVKPNLSINSTLQLRKITVPSGKTVQVSFPKIPAKTHYLVTITTPDKRTLTLAKGNLLKGGSVTLPVIQLTNPGTSAIMLRYGKVVRTISISVINPSHPSLKPTPSPSKSNQSRPTPKTSQQPKPSPSKGITAKKISVICTNGKTKQVVTSSDPRCPSGFWRK